MSSAASTTIVIKKGDLSDKYVCRKASLIAQHTKTLQKTTPCVDPLSQKQETEDAIAVLFTKPTQQKTGKMLLTLWQHSDQSEFKINNMEKGG